MSLHVTFALVAGLFLAPPAAFAQVLEVPLGELDGERGFQVVGAGVQDHAGVSVGHLGDVDGDGLPDFALSTSDDTGQVHIVLGAPGLGQKGALELAMLKRTQGFTIYGDLSGDATGQALGGGGDVNGDGFPDILLGSPYAHVGAASEQGKCYVVFGGAGIGAGGSLFVDTLDGTNGFVLEGEHPGDGLGRSVAGGGDFNGDGRADLLVGASAAQPGGIEAAGTAYVVLGSTGLGAGGTLGIGSLPAGQRLSLNGSQAFGLAGWSVAFAGDFDGDGDSEALVGAPGQDASTQGGAAYLVFGRTSLPPSGALALGSLAGADGASFLPEAFGDELGFTVAAAGDVNADGLDDVLLGARHHAAFAGAAYLILGTHALPGSVYPLSLLQPGDGVRLLGAGAAGNLGEALGPAGDANRDGVPDFLLGAPSFDGPGAVNQGRAYLLHGSPLLGVPTTLSLASLDVAHGRVLSAEEAGDRCGSGVGGGGDYDGDGFSDFLIGARDADGPSLSNAGKVYVLTDISTKPSLDAAPAALSIATGGSQTLWAAPGTQYAGLVYVFIGSATGTTPGVPFAGLILPVTPDWYFSLLLTGPNPGFFPAQFGFLDGAGEKVAAVVLPPAAVHAGLAGTTFHHACLVLDPVTGTAPFVTASQPLTLTP